MATWRLYGAEIMGVAVNEDGSPALGWVEVIAGECRNPETAPEFVVPAMSSNDGGDPEKGEMWHLPLIATWDHEPNDEERNAVKPEEYRADEED